MYFCEINVLYRSSQKYKTSEVGGGQQASEK